MQTKVIECLPTRETHFKVVDVGQRLHALQVSSWGKMADRGSRSRLENTLSMVNAIAEERCPYVGEALSNDFLRPIVDQFQYMVPPQADAKASSSGGGGVITGVGALTMLLALARDKLKAGKLVKEYMTHINCFAFLLTREQQNAASECMASLEKKADATVKLAKVAKTKGKKEASKTAISADCDRSMAASRRMFS